MQGLPQKEAAPVQSPALDKSRAFDMVYSQRKKRTARIVQIAVTASMTQIGDRTLPVPIPKNVCFISVMPCVSGKKLTILCIMGGMTSTGSVVPEKISIGK